MNKKSKKKSKKKTPSIVKGILKMHPRGFGFFKPEKGQGLKEDVFIPRHRNNYAVDGDYVEVELNKVRSKKGFEGEVIAIINRSRTHVAGIISYVLKNGSGNAYVPILGKENSVLVEPSPSRKLKLGDRITIQITSWQSDYEDCCMGVEAHYLGNIDDSATDVYSTIEEFDLRHRFPHKVDEELKKFGSTVPASEIKKREDLRDLECFTIDPKTAKDFDDAVSISKDKGGYLLGVHIADVSHYVTPNSTLDTEASMRCNSTYFPGICIPMLPEKLSNNLCSLKPNVNRLTVSVFMTFNKNGDLTNYRISKAVIKSKKRFSYEEAYEIIQNKKQNKFKTSLDLMVELCDLLKKKRRERGSIEFALTDLAIEVNKSHEPTEIRTVEYDISHQLIEEFMLKANEVIATHLKDKKTPLIYRVHPNPKQENLEEFALLANALGFKIKNNPSVQDLQKLFNEIKETHYEKLLTIHFIKSMKIASYSKKNIGHYGLALENYTHFTSPIRRYIDLVIHRQLFEKTKKKTSLDDIAENCSNQERVSQKAEQSIVLLKKLRFLNSLRKKEPNKRYEAIITHVTPFGFSFELVDYMLEEFIHVSEMGHDYYVFNATKKRLEGDVSGEKYCYGQKIKVKLRHIDLIRLESSWMITN